MSNDIILFIFVFTYISVSCLRKEHTMGKQYKSVDELRNVSNMTSREWTDVHKRAHGDFSGEQAAVIVAAVAIAIGVAVLSIGLLIHNLSNFGSITRYIYP